MSEARPEGYNYKVPDPEVSRCPSCNPDGMNRTGLRPTCFIGTTVSGAYAVRCERGCYCGLSVEANPPTSEGE